MYCSQCGKQLPDGVTECPDCSPETVEAQVVYTPGQQSQQTQQTSKKKVFQAPGKFGKSYAALTTAFLVFPATICVAIDFLFHSHDYWCDYVIGALAVTWMITVFPALKLTKPAINGLIIFGSIMAYLYYIAYRAGRMDWLSNFLLPMIILSAAFIALDVSLIGGKKVKGLHILSLLSLEAMAYLICLEATLDRWLTGAIELRWSIIIACGFISVIAVMEAFSYVAKINKK